jgi:hypothetical protein
LAGRGSATSRLSHERIVGWLGAQNFRYAETFEFGRPGRYQRFVCAFNDAGFGQDSPEGLFGDGPFSIHLHGLGGDGELETRVRQWRQTARINTWTVVGLAILVAAAGADEAPLVQGVDSESLRTLT